MKFDISASIVLYDNQTDMVARAIRSFLNTELRVILYLIDNSYTNKLNILADNDRIKYFHNPSNPGFGTAHNLAIKIIMDESTYHLVLNPDIYFEPGNLELLFSYMERNQNVAHVMPKVLYPDGAIQYLCKNNPTPFDLLVRRFLPGFLKKIFKKRMDKFEYRDRNYNQEIHRIPYLSGCFMFIRTDVLKKVGYFDERIFMYIEDADLTRRILQVADTAYFPEAQVYHHYAKGSYKNWRLTLYNIHGAFIYFNKWGWF